MVVVTVRSSAAVIAPAVLSAKSMLIVLTMLDFDDCACAASGDKQISSAATSFFTALSSL